MKENSYHVVRNPNHGWSVKKSGSHRASGTYGTQEEAVVEAKRLALKKDADVFVHGRDGRIRDAISVLGHAGAKREFDLLKDGGEWRLIESETNKVIFGVSRKASAMEMLNGFMSAYRGRSVRIHRRDGRIQGVRTYVPGMKHFKSPSHESVPSGRRAAFAIS